MKLESMSASSMGRWDYCQMRYFIEYQLKYRGKANQKAEMGTIVHKVLECLGNLKLCIQNGEKSFVDKHLGEIFLDEDLLYKPYPLTNEQVDKLNKARVSKDIYKWPVQIDYGQIHFGKEVVDSLIEAAYNHHVLKSEFEWKNIHFRDVYNWTWIALEYRSGKIVYDPRFRNILSLEGDFELYLPEIPDVKLKGFIDAIYQDDDGHVEIVDWKTGQMMDWNKMEAKTYENLQTDVQLNLYNMAYEKLLSSSYDSHPSLDITIFYIRGGGPYTLSFSEKDVDRATNQIVSLASTITQCEVPKLTDESRTCQKCRWCDFRDNGMCHAIKESIDIYGLEETIRFYKKEEEQNKQDQQDQNPD